jgi:hypothetical protein
MFGGIGAPDASRAGRNSKHQIKRATLISCGSIRIVFFSQNNNLASPHHRAFSKCHAGTHSPAAAKEHVWTPTWVVLCGIPDAILVLEPTFWNELVGALEIPLVVEDSPCVARNIAYLSGLAAKKRRGHTNVQKEHSIFGIQESINNMILDHCMWNAEWANRSETIDLQSI